MARLARHLSVILRRISRILQLYAGYFSQVEVPTKVTEGLPAKRKTRVQRPAALSFLLSPLGWLLHVGNDQIGGCKDRWRGQGRNQGS